MQLVKLQINLVLEIMERISTLYVKNLNDKIKIEGKIKRNEEELILLV